MRGVIYARYSSDNQREESIDGQIRECKVFAERNGIDIIGSYIDRAFSAKTDNRPDFQRMIKDSEAKRLTLCLFGNLIDSPVTDTTRHITNGCFARMALR